jgi:hypothetical protein
MIFVAGRYSPTGRAGFQRLEAERFSLNVHGAHHPLYLNGLPRNGLLVTSRKRSSRFQCGESSLRETTHWRPEDDGSYVNPILAFTSAD